MNGSRVKPWRYWWLMPLLIFAGILVPGLARADTYNEMFATADWLARKYGVTVYIAHAPMAYGVYAATAGNEIVFNTFYIEHPDILAADVMGDIAAGYHPGLRCTPAAYVATHEMGHVLDNVTGRTAQTELALALTMGLDGKVSGYAVTSMGEALAEAFAAVECDTPSPAARALYQMLTT